MIISSDDEFLPGAAGDKLWHILFELPKYYFSSLCHLQSHRHDSQTNESRQGDARTEKMNGISKNDHL